MKASDLFVEALVNEGVERIFGVPGEENLDFLDSLSRSPIEMVLTRHEQAAGFMAATHGRLTGKAGVCLSTLGPGATNLMTAAAYANLGAMPMVMLTGQKPIKSSKQGQFQIVDVVDMMQPLTKFSRRIGSGDLVPASVREAFRRAEEERPGAVHLELPEDIAQEDTDASIIPPSFIRRPVAEQKAIARAVEVLTKAKRPLLLIGAGANRKRTSQMLHKFVDKTRIRCVATQMGKGVVSEDHPCFLGNAALSSGDFVHRAFDTADVIMNVGHDVVEKPPFFMEKDGCTVIHVNFTSAEVDPVYFPQLEVIGDIADSVHEISERLPEPLQWDTTFFDKVRTALSMHIGRDADADQFPVLPQRLVADVRRAMPRDGIVALDNGMYKLWFARNYPAYTTNTALLDNALASMGAGLPSAIMAAMVNPDQRVIAVCGDGGFMMNSAELETAVRLGLNLVVLLLRDDALGMIQWKQEDMGFSDYGLTFHNPDFVKYAESYGAVGHQVTSTDQLLPSIHHAFDRGGVHLIDVPVDYSDNDRILNQEIQELSGRL
ncbi:acetolactate synthase large subunit [Allorhodopirellula solitaria]|uniref:Acetolactate synthase, catabolic n=1 Tax=Allorhodopirellula solitaria TaxID=2527987 RepID=A0A5C5YHI0_9BACT|nr:acetolactate synthase large subunit [Allorhodopirellula solitaria]TWT72902.1 Acetolactate synthase, catabolic [Allorhodopirellula solitaria]